MGDPGGKAWTQHGDLDRYGHNFGCSLAHHVEGELSALANRVLALLHRGWERVTIVTDHGWLLLPGGLPKAELPEHLTVVRKGRCARFKDMAHTDQLLRSRQGVRVRGISPRECVVPMITVTQAVVRRRLAIESVA